MSTIEVVFVHDGDRATTVVDLRPAPAGHLRLDLAGPDDAAVSLVFDRAEPTHLVGLHAPDAAERELRLAALALWGATELPVRGPVQTDDGPTVVECRRRVGLLVATWHQHRLVSSSLGPGASIWAFDLINRLADLDEQPAVSDVAMREARKWLGRACGIAVGPRGRNGDEPDLIDEFLHRSLRATESRADVVPSALNGRSDRLPGDPVDRVTRLLAGDAPPSRPGPELTWDGATAASALRLELAGATPSRALAEVRRWAVNAVVAERYRRWDESTAWWTGVSEGYAVIVELGSAIEAAEAAACLPAIAPHLHLPRPGWRDHEPFNHQLLTPGELAEIADPPAARALGIDLLAVDPGADGAVVLLDAGQVVRRWWPDAPWRTIDEVVLAHPVHHMVPAGDGALLGLTERFDAEPHDDPDDLADATAGTEPPSTIEVREVEVPGGPPPQRNARPIGPGPIHALAPIPGGGALVVHGDGEISAVRRAGIERIGAVPRPASPDRCFAAVSSTGSWAVVRSGQVMVGHGDRRRSAELGGTAAALAATGPDLFLLGTEEGSLQVLTLAGGRVALHEIPGGVVAIALVPAEGDRQDVLVLAGDGRVLLVQGASEPIHIASIPLPDGAPLRVSAVAAVPFRRSLVVATLGGEVHEIAWTGDVRTGLIDSTWSPLGPLRGLRSQAHRVLGIGSDGRLAIVSLDPLVVGEPMDVTVSLEDGIEVSFGRAGAAGAITWSPGDDVTFQIDRIDGCLLTASISPDAEPHAIEAVTGLPFDLGADASGSRQHAGKRLAPLDLFLPWCRVGSLLDDIDTFHRLAVTAADAGAPRSELAELAALEMSVRQAALPWEALRLEDPAPVHRRATLALAGSRLAGPARTRLDRLLAAAPGYESRFGSVRHLLGRSAGPRLAERVDDGDVLAELAIDLAGSDGSIAWDGATGQADVGELAVVVDSSGAWLTLSAGAPPRLGHRMVELWSESELVSCMILRPVSEGLVGTAPSTHPFPELVLEHHAHRASPHEPAIGTFTERHHSLVAAGRELADRERLVVAAAARADAAAWPSAWSSLASDWSDIAESALDLGVTWLAAAAFGRAARAADVGWVARATPGDHSGPGRDRSARWHRHRATFLDPFRRRSRDPWLPAWVLAEVGEG